MCIINLSILVKIDMRHFNQTRLNQLCGKKKLVCFNCNNFCLVSILTKNVTRLNFLNGHKNIDM